MKRLCGFIWGLLIGLYLTLLCIYGMYIYVDESIKNTPRKDRSYNDYARTYERRE